MKYQPFCLAILFRGVYAAATHPAAAPTTHNNIPTVVSTKQTASAYHPTEISNIGDLIPSSTAVITQPSISRRNLNSELFTCPTPPDDSRCVVEQTSTATCSTADGSPCYKARGPVGVGSCIGNNACVEKTADVKNNACVGTSACKESGGESSTIYDNSCDGSFACYESKGTIGAQGEPSCQGEFSCYKTTGTIGKNSCNGPYACCGHVGDVDPNQCNSATDGYSRCCVPSNDCQCAPVPTAMPSVSPKPSLSSVPSQSPSESLQPSSNPSETPSLSIAPSKSSEPSESSRPSTSVQPSSNTAPPSVSSMPSATCVDICDGYNPFTFDPPYKSTRSGPTNSPTKWSKPTWNKPTRKPTWSKPTNKPVWSKPTDKPKWSKPTPEPTKSSSPSESSKPSWNKPTWSKLTDKPPKKKPRRELDAHFNSYWPGDYEFWTATNSENGGVAMNWQVNRTVDRSTSSGYDYFLQSPAYNGATTERNAQAILQLCSNFAGGTIRVNYTANVNYKEWGQLFQVYVCPNRGNCDVDNNLVTGGNITTPVTKPTILPISLGPGPHYIRFSYTWFPQTELPPLDSGVVKIYEVDVPCGPPKFPTFSPTTVPSLAPSVSPTSVPSANPTSSPSGSPSRSPSDPPTGDPTTSPTLSPTVSPTLSPTLDPTTSPTLGPTMSPINPTLSPSLGPTKSPTLAPSFSPTTPEPTLDPTLQPTDSPTKENPFDRLPTTAKPTGGGWSPPHDKPDGGWSPPHGKPDGGGWSPPHDKPNGGWSPPHNKPDGGWSPPNSNPADDGWNSQSPIAWKNDGWGKSGKANTKASKAKTLKSRLGPKRWIPASGGDWLSYGGWETADWGSDSDSDDFSWSGKWAGRYDSSSWSDTFKWDRPMRGKSSKSKSSKKGDSWNNLSMSYSNEWWNDDSSKFVWDTQSKSSKGDGMSMTHNNDWWNAGSSSSIPGGLWIDPAYSGSSSSQSHQSSQQSVGENLNKPTSNNDSQSEHHVGQSGKDESNSYNLSESTQSTKSSKVGQIERSPPHSNGSSEEISIEDYNKMKYWAEKKWQNKKQSSKSAGVRVGGSSSMSRMMLLTSTVAMPLLLGFFAFL